MSVSQLFAGRVSQPLATRRMAETIAQGQISLAKLQAQLATGMKFQLPSEAPTAATQVLMLQKLDERQAAFAQSVQTNYGYLVMADQAMDSVSESIAIARGLAQAGAGDQITTAEREGLAQEVAGLIRAVIQAGNTQHTGRYLFAGSASSAPPFELTATGEVRYSGNMQNLAGLADFGMQIQSSVSGVDGFAAITAPEWQDLNPAVTLQTALSDLYGGSGVSPGSVRVLLDDGVDTIDREVDLTGAKSIQDIKNRLEAAFAAEAIQITVDVDPLSQHGLRITPSAGTIEIRDVPGSTTARDLGVVSGPVAELNGRDLDPRISLMTPISALNGGTGIGDTNGTGLRLVQGDKVSIADLDGAVTVHDLLNRIRAATPDVITDISPDGQGIFISSRISGSSFSIGENGGENATRLGLRTFVAESRIDDLRLGLGIPRDSSSLLELQRRDGTTLSIDVRQALTVQDVLDAINTIDPGVLVAELSSVGNGITLRDASGTGPLVVADNAISNALGMDGSDNGGPAGAIVGRDVHPRQPNGVLNHLVALERAIRNDDKMELGRLATGLDREAARFSSARGSIGIQMRQYDNMGNILADRHVNLRQQLERLFDVDYAEAITMFTAQQQALEAFMAVSSRIQQLTLLQYL